MGSGSDFPIGESIPHKFRFHANLCFPHFILFPVLLDDIQQDGQWLHGLLASCLWRGGRYSYGYPAGMEATARRHVGTF